MGEGDANKPPEQLRLTDEPFTIEVNGNEFVQHEGQDYYTRVIKEGEESTTYEIYDPHTGHIFPYELGKYLPPKH